MTGNYHLMPKPGFEFGLLLIGYEERSKSTGESDEYEAMKQVGTGK